MKSLIMCIKSQKWKVTSPADLLSRDKTTQTNKRQFFDKSCNL